MIHIGTLHQKLLLYKAALTNLNHGHANIQCPTTSLTLSVFVYKTRKNALDRGQTSRISLTHDPDLQSSTSYGHDLLTCKSSRSTVNRFGRQSGNKRKDGWTDGD